LVDGPEDAHRRRHVVLVGMMGSGKTTVGRRVAARLDRPFLDADDELESRSGRTVREWFAEAGEVAFRDAESATLAALLDHPEPAVIAAGGGVVIRAENRSALAAPFVVLLDAGPAFLASRVARKAHRPLVDDDPLGTIERLHRERDGWYREVADVVVPVEPAHETDHPKRALAGLVVDLVVAHEGAPAPAGDSMEGSVG
jgi:shikimate kinase